MKAPGLVTLVGAGPGDPELITVRGRNRLEQADVVIYDELAGTDLLAYCPASCVRVYVGKRCGRYAKSQEDIIALMREHAASGRRVVRLKGGDPFIFGRGGEELEAMIAAGVPCEVVPGVTAASAAGAIAGVPLTHRGIASAVVFLTGHESPDKAGAALDWERYAQLGATLCVYMATRRLGEVARRLRDAGLRGETPVALVSRASRPDQQVRRLTLEQMISMADEELPAPALAIIGEVAAVGPAAPAT